MYQYHSEEVYGQGHQGLENRPARINKLVAPLHVQTAQIPHPHNPLHPLHPPANRLQHPHALASKLRHPQTPHPHPHNAHKPGPAAATHLVLLLLKVQTQNPRALQQHGQADSLPVRQYGRDYVCEFVEAAQGVGAGVSHELEV